MIDELNIVLNNLNDDNMNVFLDCNLILHNFKKSVINNRNRYYLNFFYFNKSDDQINNIGLSTIDGNTRININDVFQLNNDEKRLIIGVIDISGNIIIEDLVIDSYTTNIETFNISRNKKIKYSFSSIQEFFLEKHGTIQFESYIIPSINIDYWQCICGFLNSLENKKCKNCDKKFDEIQILSNSTDFNLIFEQIFDEHPIVYNFNKNLKENLEPVFQILRKNNIEINLFLGSTKYTQLESSFNLTKKKIFFDKDIFKQDINIKISFNDYINYLRDYYTEFNISHDEFNEWVNLRELNNIYYLKKENKKEKKFKYFIYIFIIIGILFLAYLLKGKF